MRALKKRRHTFTLFQGREKVWQGIMPPPVPPGYTPRGSEQKKQPKGYHNAHSEDKPLISGVDKDFILEFGDEMPGEVTTWILGFSVFMM